MLSQNADIKGNAIYIYIFFLLRFKTQAWKKWKTNFLLLMQWHIQALSQWCTYTQLHLMFSCTIFSHQASSNAHPVNSILTINDTHRYAFPGSLNPSTWVGKFSKIFLGFLEITAFFSFITSSILPSLDTEMWMMNHQIHSPERITCHLLKLQATEVRMSVCRLGALPLKHLR